MKTFSQEPTEIEQAMAQLFTRLVPKLLCFLPPVTEFFPVTHLIQANS